MKGKIILTGFIIYLFSIQVNADNKNKDIAIGEWRTHFSYYNGLQLLEVKNRIYCITTNGMFYYDNGDNSVHTISKSDGFTDVNAVSMAYDDKHDALFIGYKDGYFDILQGNTIYNRTEIATYSGSISHDINSFYFHGDSAYIATSFGVVVYQLKKNIYEIRQKVAFQ